MEKLKLTEGKSVVLSEDKKYTNEDLKIMQAWGLQKKIQVTQTRILEWYKAWNGQVYVSFSGGKDSTVLADLAARVCKVNGYKLILWFSDTGLEYPEVREHPQKQMKKLGFNVVKSEPIPIADCWIFEVDNDIENIPEYLVEVHI